MDKKRFNIWYILLAVWGVLIIQSFISQQYGPRNIPYSEFLGALNQGRIKEVAVRENVMEGLMLAPAEGEAANATTGANATNATTGKGEKLEEVRFHTVRVGPDVSKQLEAHGVVFRGELENKFLAQLLSWVVPLALFLGLWIYLMKRFNPGAGMMQFGKNKAKVFAEKDIETRFSDVAGADEAKYELQEIIEFLKDPSIFTNLGGRMPKGVLLVGPPGTGKTLLARAAAGEAGVPFFSLSGSEFVEMFVGMGAARVRDLFTQAKEKAPCIVFIDELDAIGKARGMGAMSGHDEREQTLNQLLVEMDGFDPRVGVIIMAATNRPEILDPALLRAGRFDRHVLVDKPDVLGRKQILEVHARRVQLGDDVDLQKIAQQTPGFSGADLANVVNEAALLAARKHKKHVMQEDFSEAVDRIVGGLEKKNRLINPKEKKIVAYHETGHALVAAFTPGADPVAKISIIPRGLAALGYTQQRPTEDRYLMAKSELLAKVDVMLGGRVAEQLIFGDVTTGAHNDLQRASDTIRAMLTEYGMGETLGLASFERSRPTYLELQQGGGHEYSESTAARIDEELKSTLEERRKHVAALLEKHRDLLEKVAEKLLEQEVVDEEEFLAIIRPSLEAEGVDPDKAVRAPTSSEDAKERRPGEPIGEDMG
ncbi:ATP-dependent zinc metalloprotease FtsH [Oceanidesulfovibrio marinus]|uniref:ATP-dependent zinc metalloprotease FtsH n=1 Tax=Oceanidesulfovibrio marinus TaxID=370038 RepID=A0A6P1ZDY7_9BACT|nr:ATP-dependent zinc metalloprotease FtsH [Oceanidesulfovibrio marinus]QJT11110.1 ATP-dependent zinc metalloprotease FtsH [Oceanidesulfovibrio marinus]TVM31721.1 cell division protein FtsH [Oceanidesulfovibrio marinus]